MPVSSFYANFVISQGKSNIFMWNTVALCLAQMLLLIILYPYGVEAMVIAYVVVNTLCLFVWHWFVKRLIGVRFWHALRDVIPFALIAAVAMAAGWGMAQLSGGNLYLSLLLKIVGAVIAYVLLLRLLGAEILNECTEFVKSKIPFRRKA